MKELKADIPVLKVVGGATLAELCQNALEKLPEGALAGIGRASEGSATVKSDMKQSQLKPPTQLQMKVKEQDQNIESESSSTSGDNVDSTTMTPGVAGSVTPISTPSSARSESDPIDLEPAKTAPSIMSSSPTIPQSLDRPSRRYLKSERISLPQSRFWFLRHLLEDPTTPNVVFSYRVAGNLRVGDLERALRVVTLRHEALRTCFVQDETDAGEAYQKILPSSPLRLERKKLTSLDDVATEYATLKEHVFDLENGDLMRVILLTISSTTHFLLINYHHIVMDGASFNIFISDLEKAYEGVSLGPPARQYPDFSVAQRQAIEDGQMRDELNNWRKIFPAGEQPSILPLLPMARTTSRVAMKGYDSHQVGRHLEPSLVARVKSLSQKQGSTPFHLHLAAFKALLFCLAGEDTKDLTIGIADAARNEDEVKGSVGFFLNLLPLRFHRQPDQTFADSVVESRDTTYSALGNSRLPFDVLLTELDIARSALHSPFFQAFLDYRQGAQDKHKWGNCQFEFQDVHPGRTAYDITLDVTEWSATDTLVMIRTQKALYDLTAASLLLDTYIHFLEVVTSDASVPLKSTSLFSETQLLKAVEIGRGESMI